MLACILSITKLDMILIIQIAMIILLLWYTIRAVLYGVASASQLDVLGKFSLSVVPYVISPSVMCFGLILETITHSTFGKSRD